MRQIVVFSGGRGGASILSALAKDARTAVSVLINGFDDGKSTGTIRRLFPTMLGPSDFRKVSHLLSNRQDIAKYDERCSIRPGSFDAVRADMVTAGATSRGIEACEEVHRLVADSGEEMVYGNLLFAAKFLLCGNFRETVRWYAELCGVPEHVSIIPVSTKPNALFAQTLSGGILTSETSICEAIEPIVDVRLAYPDHCTPEAMIAFDKADAVLLAPGTFPSSIWPSLVVMESVIARQRSKALTWIANFRRDAGMQGWSVLSGLERIGKFASARAVVDPDSELAVSSGDRFGRVAHRFIVDGSTGRHDGPSTIEALRGLGWL